MSIKQAFPCCISLLLVLYLDVSRMLRPLFPNEAQVVELSA